MQLHLDSQHSRNKLKPDQSGYPVPDDTPRRKVGFYDNQIVSDLLVDSNTDGSGWTRIWTEVVIQCQSRHRRSLQSVGRHWNIASGQDIWGRTTHRAEKCFFMTIRQSQTFWWTRIQTEVVIQCQGRHRRSLQSIRCQWNIASGRGSRNRQYIRQVYHEEWWGF